MQRDRKAAVLTSLFVLFALQTTAVFLIGTPGPMPEGEARFSADRAFGTLTELVQNEQPRPTRSKANVNFRTRLVAHLESIGYEPSVQSGMMRPFVVHNVYAELHGTAGPDAPLILLVAHHDTVHSSPGAADDGAGVATLLETARLWKQRAAPRNAVGFLFTDGEESGMLGARLFVAEHPAFARVALVLNFEARGVRGPSAMFETFGGDRDLIAVYGQVVDRPFASSVFKAAYETMPNDTDLTVFGRAGKRGMNFAFIDGAEHYHQPGDSLANLSRGSLQHHGDQAWSLSVAFAGMDPTLWSTSDAVYFDVFQLFMVHWPANLSPFLAIAAFLLLLLARWLYRRPRLPVWRRIVAELSMPVLLFGGLGIGWLVAELLLTTGLLLTAYPDPLWPVTALYWAGVALVFAAVARWTVRNHDAVLVFIETYHRLAVIGLVLAWLTPGVSYLLTLPALAAAVLAVPMALRAPGGAMLTGLQLLPLLIAGVLWLPLLDRLPVALGAQAGAVIGAAQGLFLCTMLPLCAGHLPSKGPSPELHRELTVDPV